MIDPARPFFSVDIFVEDIMPFDELMHRSQVIENVDQHLAFARLSATEKLKLMEELLEAFQDRMPRHEFLESW